jgi:hypothetical protein
MQVDGCGAGVLLIAQTAIETMLKKMPKLSAPTANNSPLAANLDRLIRAFEPLRVNDALLSVDFSFCHRWNACGGQVWVNTAHEIEHIGLHGFKGRYSYFGPRLALESCSRYASPSEPAQPKPRGSQRLKILTEPGRNLAGWGNFAAAGPPPSSTACCKKIRRQTGGFFIERRGDQDAASCMASAACSCMIVMAAGTVEPASATEA